MPWSFQGCMYYVARSRAHTTLVGFRSSHDAGLSPCARNTIREAISRDMSIEQPTCRTRCPKDPRTRSAARSAAGTFSGHRQRSRRICHQKCGCRVSPSTSGSLRSRIGVLLGRQQQVQAYDNGDYTGPRSGRFRDHTSYIPPRLTKVCKAPRRSAIQVCNEPVADER